MIIQQTKFEILSEMGVRGIVNRSYRDAVSSFATCLERLHEYFVEAVCRKHGIIPEVFAATWKSMARQSERQLGAFLAGFLLDTRQTAKLLPQTQVAFRNAVVHNGRFPSREEAIRFGQDMFDCALPILTVLRSAHYAETVRILAFERIRDQSKQPVQEGLQISTISIATPLSIAVADQPADIETIVATYANRPDLKSAVEEAQKLGERRLPR